VETEPGGGPTTKQKGAPAAHHVDGWQKWQRKKTGETTKTKKKGRRGRKGKKQMTNANHGES